MIARWGRTGYAALAACSVLLALRSVAVILTTDATVSQNLVVQLSAGVVLPVVGTAIVGRDPRHVIAWVYLVSSLAGSVSLAAEASSSVTVGSATAGVAVWLGRWIWIVTVVGPVTIGLATFPDGRLPSRRDRWIWAAAGGAVLASLVANGFTLSAPGEPPNPLAVLPADSPATALGALVPLLLLAGVVGAARALWRRWRVGDETLRSRLIWLLLGAVTFAFLLTLDAVLPSAITSTLAVVAWAALPVSVGVGILAGHVLDAGRVISRSLTFGLLATTLLAVHVVVSSVSWDGPAGTLLSAAVVAAVLTPTSGRISAPIEAVIERMVRRGDDPARVLDERLGEAEDHDEVLDAVLHAVVDSLGLDHAAIDLGDGVTVAHGPHLPADARHVELTHRGAIVGTLILGGPRGADLSASQERRLAALVARAGPAIEAVRLSRELERSRSRVVLAREDERLRLHRELHDDLGPSLAGVALQLDVIASSLLDRPTDARAMLTDVRGQLEGLVPGIRLLVEGLRPPALDELGLEAALRQHAAMLDARGPTRFLVDVDGPLPPLPAGVEVAAYRIATEAMTNVVRHASATCCTLRLRSAGSLVLEVSDDGCGVGPGRHVGVGVPSMQQRARELGGRFELRRRDERGGTIATARLPLGVPV